MLKFTSWLKQVMRGKELGVMVLIPTLLCSSVVDIVGKERVPLPF